MQYIKYYNYTIINGNKLIFDTDKNVLNYYYSNNLVIKKIDKDFKKIFVHFLLKDICIDSLKIKSGFKKILFVNFSMFRENAEIFEYIDFDSYIVFCKKILEEITNVIPITLVQSIDLKFENISEKYNDLRYMLDANDNMITPKSIHKLIQYTKQLGLNLLDKKLTESEKYRKIFI